MTQKRKEIPAFCDFSPETILIPSSWEKIPDGKSLSISGRFSGQKMQSGFCKSISCQQIGENAGNCSKFVKYSLGPEQAIILQRVVRK